MFVTPTQRDNLAAAINFTLLALTSDQPNDRARAAGCLATAIVDMLDPTYDPKQVSEADRAPSSRGVGAVLASIPGYDPVAHRKALSGQHSATNEGV